MITNDVCESQTHFYIHLCQKLQPRFKENAKPMIQQRIRNNHTTTISEFMMSKSTLSFLCFGHEIKSEP